MAYKISDSCIACGTCIDECPVEAISAGDIYVIDPGTCIDCGSCASVCPTESISPADQRENEIYQIIKATRITGGFYYSVCDGVLDLLPNNIIFGKPKTHILCKIIL